MITPAYETFAATYDSGAAALLATRLVGDLETPVSAFLKLSVGRKGPRLPAGIGRRRRRARTLFDDRARSGYRLALPGWPRGKSTGRRRPCPTPLPPAPARHLRLCARLSPNPASTRPTICRDGGRRFPATWVTTWCGRWSNFRPPNLTNRRARRDHAAPDNHGCLRQRHRRDFCPDAVRPIADVAAKARV